MDFDSFGNAMPGIHQVNLSEFEEIFVLSFKKSSKREQIYSNFIKFFNLQILNKYRTVISKLWIDGSFSTAKVEPNDIDGIIFLKFSNDEEYHLAMEFQELHATYFKKLAYEYDCDLYVQFDIDKIPTRNSVNESYSRFYDNVDLYTKYWMGQFCFDRQQRPKGIFELEFKESEFYG